MSFSNGYPKLKDDFAEVTLFAKTSSTSYRIPRIKRYCRSCFNSQTTGWSSQYIAQGGPDSVAWSLPIDEQNLVVQGRVKRSSFL